MDTPKNTTPNELEEVEDLTMFADESFDTQDVDLFEFTGEDGAPLIRLKSIILSLDWEINDQILKELTDEVKALQQMWEDDKVAKVYLQGLDKIGSYLGAEGAYAHPNAIKLLLTLFYNFEKIISSESITGEAITTLLKADVRKFKILQYQINQSQGKPVPPTVPLTKDSQSSSDVPSPVECEPLTCLKAIILGLEWEVTDDGLEQFNARIADVREHFMDNKSAHILIQGLQALGGYITDERAQAHPDAFSLLHSFYGGLEQLLQEDLISEEERQNILIDRVGRLNALKVTLAEAQTETPAPTIDNELEDILSIAGEEENDEENINETDELESVSLEDTDFFPDMSDDTARDIQLPEGTPLFEEETSLAEEKEEASFPLSSDQDDEVSESFSFAEEDEEKREDENISEDILPHDLKENIEEASYPDEILDPSAIQPIDDEVADDFLEEELNIGALLTEGSLEAPTEETQEEPLDDAFEEELDLFFAEDDKGEGETFSLQVEQAAKEDVEEFELSFSDEDDDDGTNEGATALAEALAFQDESDSKEETTTDALFVDFDEDDALSVQPAFADIAEEEATHTGDEGRADGKQSPSEISAALDAFFGAEEASEEATEDRLITPALADAEEETGFNEDVVSVDIEQTQSSDLDEKLDAFFGAEEEEFLTADKGEGDLTLTPALADAEDSSGFNEEEASDALEQTESSDLDEKLEAFFGADEDDAIAVNDVQNPPSVIPALAETEEEAGFNEEEAGEILSEEPVAELDKKLEAFFESEEEPVTIDDEQDEFTLTPALADAEEEAGFNEEEAGEILSEEPVAELDEKLEAFFESEEEPALVEEIGDNQKEEKSLQALASVFANFAETPTVALLEESKDLVQQLQLESNQDTEHIVLLQLLSSALSLVPEDTALLPDNTADLLEFVRNGLEKTTIEPDVLVAAINRFTNWQKTILSNIIESRTAASTTPPPAAKEDFAQVTTEVRSGLEELRSTLKDEFNALRSELKGNND